MSGPIKDYSGARFGRLTVVSYVGKDASGHSRWLCRCDCGNETISIIASLRYGRTISCGCYQREEASRRWREEHLTHGKSSSRLYRIWNAMKQRCNNPNVKEYPLYGGRGIKVCQEWESNYLAFEKWMISNGYDENAPRGKCTIDRIDVNGNYEPNNCRIATQKEQSRNRRNSRMISYNGETKTMTAWAEQYGMSVGTLHDRLSYGWPIEKCLTQPLRHW